MTIDEYWAKSKTIKETISTISGQINRHVKNSHPAVNGDALKPLVERLAELITELQALDQEFASSGFGQ